MLKWSWQVYSEGTRAGSAMIFLPKNAFNLIWAWASKHGVPTVAFFSIFVLAVYIIVVQVPKHIAAIQFGYKEFQVESRGQLMETIHYFREERAEDRKSIDRVVDKLDKFTESVDRLTIEVRRQATREDLDDQLGRNP